MAATYIELDIRDFYETARQCLEQIADIESDQIDGLCRSIAGLKRLIGLGQVTLVVSSGRWGHIADVIEEEANRIDNFRQYRRINARLVGMIGQHSMDDGGEMSEDLSTSMP